MRLALPLPVLFMTTVLVVLVGGCGPQEQQNPALAAQQATALPAASPEAIAAPTALPTLPATPVPVATSQPAAPPPAPSPADPRTSPPAVQPVPVGSGGVPERVEIPSVGVNARVGGLGLLPDGALDAPKNPDDLGWYQLGPKPGERGNALIDGHVDWAGKVRAFWYLKKLTPGDNIVVTDSTGNKHEFAVEWLKWYDAGAPVQDLFAQSDRAELTLITCGGQFDQSTHQYLSRLAVRARLVRS